MWCHISSQHIKNGKRSNPKSYPIALYLQQRGYKDAEVTATQIKTKSRTITLPTKATQFVNNFDRGRL